MSAYRVITPGVCDEQIEHTINEQHEHGYELVAATALVTGATRLYFKRSTPAPTVPAVESTQPQPRRNGRRY